jgi:hypothetical protein
LRSSHQGLSIGSGRSRGNGDILNADASPPMTAAATRGLQFYANAGEAEPRGFVKNPEDLS